ncbi:hypothetical protein Tco_0912128 [Tanacetum coccineum]
MPAADSPTHQSLGYIPESDPEEELEEDDEEDPEEDPADYPAERGDVVDDDASEEEHLAPAPFLSEEVAERLSLDYPERAGLDREMNFTSPVHETEMPEICLPLRKRPRRTTPGPGYEVGESSAAGAARQDRPFHRRTALPMDACDQVHSEGISLRTTIMAQQSEITELQATDRRRQSVISDLLKADYRRQRQLVETLKIVKSLKTQMIELQRQQGPAKDPTEPELPEEASSSS